MPAPSPDVVGRDLGDEFVLVNLRTNRIFALNPTGARFWQLLVEGNSREEIEATLLREYDLSKAALAVEIDRIVGEFEREGIVRRTGTG